MLLPVIVKGLDAGCVSIVTVTVALGDVSGSTAANGNTMSPGLAFSGMSYVAKAGSLKVGFEAACRNRDACFYLFKKLFLFSINLSPINK